MLEELLDLLGWDGLQELARRLGGRRVYIPQQGEIVKIRAALGTKRSAKFHRIWAGDRVEVPTYQTVRRVRHQRAAREYALELLKAGGSIRQVVNQTGLSRSTVRRLRRRMR